MTDQEKTDTAAREEHEELLSRQAATAAAAAWEAEQLARHLREADGGGRDRAENLERLATSQRVVSELAALALDRRQDPLQ